MIVSNKDGTTTYLKHYGSAANPAVILLHGIGADHRMWEPQCEVLSERGYFVIAPDLFGHGSSSKMSSPELGEWENQIDALLQHFELKDCILIGVSMGGVIAQSFAKNFPEKVSCLVLSDTFGELKTVQEKALGFSQTLGFYMYKMLGGKMLAKGMGSAYQADFSKLARDYFMEVSLEADFDQLIIARKAINKINAVGKIDGTPRPALVLVGDQFGKFFIEINRKIAAGISGAKFVILKESMDPSNLVNPAAFNREVFAFLEEFQQNK